MKRFHKNILYFLLSCFLSLSVLGLNLTTVLGNPLPKEPTVSADGAVIMNGSTGEIIYGKNIDARYAPASTTKIMTALLTLENCKLDDEVIVKKNCENVDGSKIYIFEGEKFKVKDLLYALLLSSANDCATALADHIGGSKEEFANIMNKRAKELGCTNTNFVNPHGLYDPKHRTTARDLALIMKEVTKHKEYLEISKTPQYNIPPTNKSKNPRPLWNGNKLIHKTGKQYYEFCEAAKTGYTIDSLHSYVVSSKKENQQYIVSLIHDKDKQFYKDSVVLFNYAFNNFTTKKIVSKNEPLYNYKISENENISLVSDRDVFSSILNGKDEKLNIPTLNLGDLNLKDKDIKKGDFITDLKLNYAGKDYPIKLVSNEDHTSIKSVFSQSKNTSFFKNKILKYLIYFILFIIAVLIILTIISNSKRYKRSRRTLNSSYKKNLRKTRRR
ncbi:D-alanyl-D-alanine carboxypeptidase family protein [Hathewaya histolytica]|uniref:D-alanyl-D-alanine carboxypeptidase n=1 Tax=Hathewaya histolytica TaxID=1498 RepID=A0A4U9RHM7_HATHI|nr:D-alanyl-D-alanine carboxypeptidase family protein [Hathewaya histolytica]VTQ90776.1 D-alanyl-D-alanine carboxypeptidase [Hathewaya histolytica]